ncbi:MAG: hypothetical protein ACYC7D_00845 [Nitrososphaerales archaeon]
MERITPNNTNRNIATEAFETIPSLIVINPVRVTPMKMRLPS